jgi:hypothetical protein
VGSRAATESTISESDWSAKSGIGSGVMIAAG